MERRAGEVVADAIERAAGGPAAGAGSAPRPEPALSRAGSG